MAETKPLLPPALPLDDHLTSQHVKPGGLGTLTAAILVAGTMAGTGILALPGSVLNTGKKPL